MQKQAKPIDLLKATADLIDKRPEMHAKYFNHYRSIKARYHLVAERAKGKAV